MAHHPETFDAEDVQFQTRRQARRLWAVAVLAVGLTVLWGLAGLQAFLSGPAAGALILLTWSVAGGWIHWRRQHLRQVVWCVRLSRGGIIGYDYARRSVSLRWDKIHRVDVTGEALCIDGTASRVIRVPRRFEAFSALSHRVVREAERAGASVCIDGQALDAVPLRTLYPFLAPLPGASDSSASDSSASDSSASDSGASDSGASDPAGGAGETEPQGG